MKANHNIMKIMVIISLRLGFGIGILVFSAWITKVPSEPGNETFLSYIIKYIVFGP